MNSVASTSTVMVYELDTCANRPTHGAGLMRIPAVRLPVGRCPAGVLDSVAGDAHALQMIDGLLIRDVHVSDAIAGELLGPSDMLTACGGSAGLSWGGTCIVSAPTCIAIIDARVIRLLSALPILSASLLLRAAEQTKRQTIASAVALLPRAEDRVLGRFRVLADRWGQDTPDGVAVPIPLTHETIGRLVGARRPTVSLALKHLDSEGSLVRREDGSWLLSDASAQPQAYAA